jgi:hypothetical protein
LIDRQEIMDLAREFGLATNVIEKDYVLGWLPAGIGSHADLFDSLIPPFSLREKEPPVCAAGV